MVHNEIYGYLKRLPPDYVGERHTVTGKRLGIRDGKEWVEYEEVPGPNLKYYSAHVNKPRFPTPSGHIVEVYFVSPQPRAGENKQQAPDAGLPPRNDEERCG